MIPFYKPWTSGEELQHIAQAISNQSGPDARHYMLACEKWLEGYTGCLKAFLLPSCTAALEMAAILADIQPGDEVIMSSFTFPAMANAFVLRGGVPVFVDIRPDTLNIDEQLIEAAITPRSRAIVVMHYGGVACEMDSIMTTARRHGLLVIEDAAHAIGATYKGRQLGSIGHLAAFSFHKTKNVQCGEGGALLINDRRFLARAENVRENGTDRTRFLKEQGNPYTWVDVGSSFIISELSAAFLWAQFEHIDYILEHRKKIWGLYQNFLHPDLWDTPQEHNAHIFYIMTTSTQNRKTLTESLWKAGCHATSHYQPLHNAEAGLKYGRSAAPLPHAEKAAQTLLRLPLWTGLGRLHVESICRLLHHQTAYWHKGLHKNPVAKFE